MFRRHLRPVLRFHSQVRASSSKAQLPYPSNPNPTPHQIFHLPLSASQSEIKARYYDLVRIYHPDNPGSSKHPNIAHERFQAITAAYDSLRGLTPFTSVTPPTTPTPTTAAYRAAQTRQRALYTGGDDRWKDRIILFGVAATIALFITQTIATRREALSDPEERQRRARDRQPTQRSVVQEDSRLSG
ncbi:hypothetical protein BD779DRAFT_1512218 [Infundibulicybe gibba]|nr:hypothetical protein BD779DRAFT_1512218 [Infundibulicybe gibba]